MPANYDLFIWTCSDPSIRLENKRDLYMFLALHMENSPYCVAPSEEFNKTGIVVCGSDRVLKVIAMSCSKVGVHAVQQMFLNPPSLSNCTVYLSRKPCTTCTTFLIQGAISSVYYWPRAPERKGDDSEIKEDIQQADHMFLRSHINSSVLLPMTIFEMVKKIAKKVQCNGDPNRSFEIPQNFEKYCSWFNMNICQDAYLKRMKNALRCYNLLLGTLQPERKSHNENIHRHALQLCYFQASRSVLN
ncbi:cytidine and dCMP deaminase domain-containing protein 1-like [Apteryx rowi]|uniref:cytidine and dCMP deaminase domain-containing protein 1-like n=1 Tax=Apteryx rowi TaxID=308060 RepID=UPI000E1C4B05|nr:cytidine and dCMP deaminase domain-containing protein 1-like [Apteryx rowi]